MATVNFEDYKASIENAINQKIAQRVIPPDPLGFILVNGFINMSFENQVSSFSLGGPAIPMVAIVGKSTGLVYTFALKILLPQIQI